MPAPVEILRLVDHFEANKRAYLNPRYNETSLRNEFLDPFFIALGWDVGNKHMHADAYKEVVLETSQEVEGSARKPDYAFRAGGFQKFFVEAKKPSISIETDSKPAFQVRRYAWSAKLPLSILTDFEEFAVYECRNKPAESDSPATGRIELLQYTDYVKKWDWLYDTFSREAVFQGAYDRYAEGVKGKRGTQEVDDDFLKTIESWRDLLARDIARRNTALSTTELNYAVQMTIDRIIFLRICEDREIEPDGQLKTAAASPNIYASLVSLFRQADERYNSGLFHFRAEAKQSSTPDDLSLSLSVDDKALREIISGLYYPSPYVFREIPADILGQVYEKFLGKVIRLTAGHQAKVEEKPEVRKAGGVYYTPTYIVDYIVKHTVGELVKDKTPAQVAALKILDPACGSGSFLLGAYQYLLNWHTDWYASNNPEKWAKGTGAAVYPAPGGGWRLTTAEKKRILLNNIHGVDIDPQAVEVTKLSLSLKVLEGESQQTIGAQLALFRERALPDLARNIQCGNSLIGWDYTEGRLFEDEEEKRRVNPFDWESAFPQMFKRGGFDAVIGNPPYIRIQAMKEWAPLEIELFNQYYKAAGKGNYDIYVVFVEKAFSLLGENGRLGFILPHKFFNSQYGEPLRKIITQNQSLSRIIYFGDKQVFENATTYTCLLFLDKQKASNFEYENVVDINKWKNSQDHQIAIIQSEKFTNNEWNFSISDDKGLFERLSKFNTHLGNISSLFVGLQTSADTVFLFKKFRQIQDEIFEVFSKNLGKWVLIEKELLKNVVRSGDIKRYLATANALILFPYRINDKQADLLSANFIQLNYPHAWNYLEQNKKLLESREKNSFKDSKWYRFGRTQNIGIWEQSKLLVPYMTTHLSSYFDKSANLYFVNVTTGGYGITIKNSITNYEYLNTLLNSKLLDYYFKKISSTFHGGYFAANKQFIEKLPIRLIDSRNTGEKQIEEKLISFGENIQNLNKRLASTPHEKEALQREIAATDRQIDQLVYKLYGLTEGEIEIVEGG